MPSILTRPAAIASNSLDQVGTSSLPEAQLDRFLMRVNLGFPNRDAERQLLRGDWSPAESLQGLDDQTLLQLQQRSAAQYCSEGVLDYVLDIVEASRRGQEGLSPRASQGIVAAARSWALIAGRDHVLIEDVQVVLPSVVEHRLDAGCPSNAGTPLSKDLLERVNALR